MRIPVTVVPAGKHLRVESSTSLNPELVRRKIEAFRTFDLASSTLVEVTQALAGLLQGYATTSLSLRAPKIYRARKRIDASPFAHFRQLWYVPLDKAQVVQMGRLNDTGEVVFYCTDSTHIALVEVRPKVGDRVCILECELRPDAWIRVLPLGISRHIEPNKPELVPHHYEDKEHEQTFAQEQNREALRMLQGFLVEELVRIVPDEARHMYKSTVALAKLLLPPETNLDGLAYPSVASELQGMNLMLSCAAADALLVPRRAWELHLFEEIGPFTFNARQYDALEDVAADGSISWPKLPESATGK